MKPLRAPRKPLLAALLGAALLALAGTALAARMVTEVIPAGHRTAEELLPVIRPLVPPPGSVTGFYDKLIVKTTPENLAEIKRVLERLDSPPRALMITVRRGGTRDLLRDEQEAFTRLGDGDAGVSAGTASGGRGGLTVRGGDEENRARLRLSQDRSRSQERGVQRLRVLEGREAFIQAGESVPFSEKHVTVGPGGATVHEGVRFEDVTRGFYVRPSVRGDQVFLQISPQSSRFDPESGTIDTQSVHTTVSGRLGEWIAIGGVDETRNRTDTGILHRSRSTDVSRQAIYVKVEEAGR